MKFADEYPPWRGDFVGHERKKFKTSTKEGVSAPEGGGKKKRNYCEMCHFNSV